MSEQPWTNAALEHAINTPSQYDPTCRALAAEVMRVRDLINRDRTGLASALNGVRRILEGFSWLGEDGVWGCYAWDERRVETLRREFRALFDKASEVISRGLRESGLRADMAFHPSMGDALQELDELRAEVVRLQNVGAEKDGELAALQDAYAEQVDRVAELIATLPKCQHEGCGRTATRNDCNLLDLCDDDSHGCQMEPYEDLPWAACVRSALGQCVRDGEKRERDNA